MSSSVLGWSRRVTVSCVRPFFFSPSGWTTLAWFTALVSAYGSIPSCCSLVGLYVTAIPVVAPPPLRLTLAMPGSAAMRGVIRSLTIRSRVPGV